MPSKTPSSADAEKKATLHTPESSLKESSNSQANGDVATAANANPDTPLTTPVEAEQVDDTYLDEDGYTKAGAVKVLSRGQKVNTEHNKIPLAEENSAGAVTEEVIGRKTSHARGESIQSLRKKVGFSWERLGRKLVLAGVVFGVIFIVGASIAGAYLLDVWNQTQEVDLSSTPKQSSLVFASNGDLLFEYYGEERREIVPYEEIPRHMQLAIIALEDREYYYNETGIPWKNITGAAVKCIVGDGADCRGGSGLSQQYIKNITDEREATIQRKIKELFTALRLNNEKNKEEIIALYLNQVPFGNNAYGVQQASKTYFNKPVKDTTVVEACVLAGMPQKPSAFAGAIGREVNEAGTGGELFEELMFKKDECLRRMHEERLEGPNTGLFIETAEELEELQATPVVFNLRADNSPYPHFEDYVTAELRRLGISERGLYSQGYRITTTIDRDIQAKAEAAVAENYDGAIAGQGANNASVVVLDGPTGEIKAMVGSIDYNATEGPQGKQVDGQVNITTSPQQPGSSIKPYVYLTDFLQGFNPATMLLDGKMNFGAEGGARFEPKNFSDTYQGPVSIRSSLQSSLNIPAVKGAFLAAGDTAPEQANTVNEVANNVATSGKDEVIATAKRIGVDFSFEDDCYLSVAIGGCEITQLSHTTGINTIAQEGNLRTATPFKSIIDASTGEDVYAKIQESDAPAYRQIDQVIDGRYARQMANVLSDADARFQAFCGSSRRCPLAAKLDLRDQGWVEDKQVAAKTGTTDDIRDAWTVGFSPLYTTTVWVGNTDNSQMFGTANSADSAGTIWKDVMVRIHEGVEPVGFSRDGLEEVGINPETGLLGEGGVELMTAEQRQELEEARDRLNNNSYDPRKNTIFQNRSTVISRSLEINTVDGLLATERTLPQFVERRNFLQVVPEFPVGDWEIVANFFNRRYGGAPTQFSNQDQVGEADRKPRITTNVVSGAQAPGNIVLQAQITGDSDKQITKTEIYINGELVASNDQGQVLFNTVGYQSGRFSVRLRAEDSFGGSSERTFERVEFGNNEDESESPAGVTLENPRSTSISNPTITLRATSNTDFSPAPTLILTQGVVRRQCTATKNGNTYSCDINTSGYIPTTDDESRARIEFLDNSDNNVTTSARTVNLTL